ncbi:MAG: hypothetical protein HYX89_05105 [Chloroflexi bacterium]|nr:hypothetical protein [Chloroflexota bacterium]
MASRAVLTAERVTVEDSIEAFNEFAYEEGWGDGLPVIPPTEERVHAAVDASGREPHEVIGLVGPRWGKATVEKIAINAVMAGCRPEYMPVLIAAVEAVTEEAFNLYAVQATTSPVAPLLIVNGPIAEELDINAGHNCMGQGWRANLTIGRALRLILLNVGGGRPEAIDMATQGQPGKVTFCIAENERDNPWEPLHVERGFRRDESTVTAVAVTSTLDVLGGPGSAEDLLRILAGSITPLGTNNFLNGGDVLLILCPEHARILADGGYSKARIRQHLWEHARMPAAVFPRSWMRAVQVRRVEKLPEIFQTLKDDTLIPMVNRPEEFVIVVAGGVGPHSVFCPTFGHPRATTKRIER